MRPIAYISRFDIERRWNLLDFEAGSIVFAITFVRCYLSGTTFCILSDHKTVEGIGKVGGYNARVQRWLEILSVLDCILD